MATNPVPQNIRSPLSWKTLVQNYGVSDAMSVVDLWRQTVFITKGESMLNDL